MLFYWTKHFVLGEWLTGSVLHTLCRFPKFQLLCEFLISRGGQGGAFARPVITSGKPCKSVVVTDLLVSPLWRLEWAVRLHMGLGANILSSYQTSGARSEEFNHFFFFLLPSTSSWKLQSLCLVSLLWFSQLKRQPRTTIKAGESMPSSCQDF